MKNTSVKVCLIPAAGKGSRWAPISGYLPKEMLPLIDRPVIDWVVQEAIASGCRDIVVIINNKKRIIKDYLLNDKNLTKKAKFHFIIQEQPLGISHAMLLAKKIINNQPFAMALPDLPTISHEPVLKQLIKAYQQNNQKSHVISFSDFPTETLYHYTECLLQVRKDKVLEIVHFCPKDSNNKPHHPGIKIRMSGRYVFNPSILVTIDSLFKSYQKNEIKEFDAINKAMELNQSVLGYSIQGHTYDTGNPTSYIRANTAFFKKRLVRLR
jgi:UTP--glucose-1-phosphate uridylyltransferase